MILENENTLLQARTRASTVLNIPPHCLYGMDIDDANMRDYARFVLDTDETCVNYSRRLGIFATPPRCNGKMKVAVVR